MLPMDLAASDVGMKFIRRASDMSSKRILI
jgi:hypothetical protein